MQSLRDDFRQLYRSLGGHAHRYGAKNPDSVVMHWSRDWEYPWAVAASEVRSGERVLDIGCGGSPLLLLLALRGVECHGIDPEYGQGFFFNRWRRAFSYLKDSSQGLPSRLRAFLRMAFRQPGYSLRHYPKDPGRMVGRDIRVQTDSMQKIGKPDSTFDVVFCISVIEHLEREDALAGLREMERILKPGGRLVFTVDCDGEHTRLPSSHELLIDASTLELYGEADFSVPAEDDVPGEYNVVGFVLRKPMP